jgi:hypothetical protein
MNFVQRTFGPRARRSLGQLGQTPLSWPKNLLDPSYAKMVLDAVAEEEYVLRWAPIRVSSPDGTQVIEILFSSDALKIGGIRVNVSATIQQQIADAIGALLPTPKIMDLAWLVRPTTLRPVLLPIAATSDSMIQASQLLDKAIVGLDSPPGILVSQKTWAIGNSLAIHKGRAMNYGDFVIPNQPNHFYSGIATEACVSFPTKPQLGRVIQGQGWAHDIAHLDYSQIAWFVHRSCTVNGSVRDLGAVLTDAKLAPLLSHEGPLQLLRQPGVPPFACKVVLPKVAGVGDASASTFQPSAYGLCPLPPPPEGAPWATEPPMAVSAAGIVASAAVGLAAGYAFIRWMSGK